MKGREDQLPRQAITPARYYEGTLATDHHGATGERRYQSTNPMLYSAFLPLKM